MDSSKTNKLSSPWITPSMLQSRSEVRQLVTQAQATPNPHCLLVCAFWGERLESSKVCLSLVITSYSEGMELLCSFLLVSLHPCVFPVSLDHFLPQTQVHLPLRVPTWPLFSSKFSHIAPPHYYTKTQGLSLCKFAKHHSSQVASPSPHRVALLCRTPVTSLFLYLS